MSRSYLACWRRWGEVVSLAINVTVTSNYGWKSGSPFQVHGDVAGTPTLVAHHLGGDLEAQRLQLPLVKLVGPLGEALERGRPVGQEVVDAPPPIVAVAAGERQNLQLMISQSGGNANRIVDPLNDVGVDVAC